MNSGAEKVDSGAVFWKSGAEKVDLGAVFRVSGAEKTRSGAVFGQKGAENIGSVPPIIPPFFDLLLNSCFQCLPGIKQAFDGGDVGEYCHHGDGKCEDGHRFEHMVADAGHK